MISWTATAHIFRFRTTNLDDFTNELIVPIRKLTWKFEPFHIRTKDDCPTQGVDPQMGIHWYKQNIGNIILLAKDSKTCIISTQVYYWKKVNLISLPSSLHRQAALKKSFNDFWSEINAMIKQSYYEIREGFVVWHITRKDFDKSIRRREVECTQRRENGILRNKLDMREVVGYTGVGNLDDLDRVRRNSLSELHNCFGNIWGEFVQRRDIEYAVFTITPEKEKLNFILTLRANRNKLNFWLPWTKINWLTNSFKEVHELGLHGASKGWWSTHIPSLQVSKFGDFGDLTKEPTGIGILESSKVEATSNALLYTLPDKEKWKMWITFGTCISWNAKKKCCLPHHKTCTFFSANLLQHALKMGLLGSFLKKFHVIY